MSRQTTTNPGIVIRDMTREDIPNVVAIDAEVSSIKSPVSESGVIDSYITSELGLSCVAEVSGRIVGYILGRLAYTPAPDSESAWIQLIGISPEYRRQGIGKNLVDRFRQRSKAKGARAIHISVPTQDSSIQSFLKECDFRPSEWMHFISTVEK